MRVDGFALRRHTRQAYRRPRYTAAFGLSRSSRVLLRRGGRRRRIRPHPVGNRTGDSGESWLNPTSLLFGVLAFISSAFIGAVVPGLRRPPLRRAGPEPTFGGGSVWPAARARGSAVGLVVLRFDAQTSSTACSAVGTGLRPDTAVATPGRLAGQPRVPPRIPARGVAAVASLVLAWAWRSGRTCCRRRADHRRGRRRSGQPSGW